MKKLQVHHIIVYAFIFITISFFVGYITGSILMAIHYSAKDDRSDEALIIKQLRSERGEMKSDLDKCNEDYTNKHTELVHCTNQCARKCDDQSKGDLGSVLW